MNKSILRSFMVMVTIMSCLTAYGDYKSTILGDNPICYYRLDEASTSGTVATNLGGLGAAANGTYSVIGVVPNCPGALTAGGDSDASCGFDGVHGNVVVPYNAAFSSPKFSFEAWALIVNTNPPNYETVLNGRVSSPQAGFTLYAVPTVPGIWQFWMGTGSGWSTIGATNISAIAKSWTHLVGTYDGTNQAFYINGNLVKLVVAKFNPNTSGALQIGIGGSVASPSYPFTTNIDEVAIYTNALSATQVVNHYVAATGAYPAPVAPNIQLFGPAFQTNYVGENATISVTAGGTLPLAYQWTYSTATNNGPGSLIANATNSTLIISNLSSSLAYWVIITNSVGSYTSAPPAWVQVIPIISPTITTQPQSEILYAGGTTHFTCAASGAASDQMSYQWQYSTTNNNITNNIASGTNAVLVITNVQTTNVGYYQVVVGDAAGTNTSSFVTLSVLPAPATNTYPGSVMADKAVAYWRLGIVDQTNGGSVTYDLAGGFNGAYSGPVVQGQPGAITNDPDSFSTTFGGGSTYAAVPFATNINSQTFTVELWVNDNGLNWGYYRSPLAEHHPATYVGYNFYGLPGNTWAFWSGNGRAWSVLSGPAILTNTWTHLVSTYDGINMSFYVNGVQVSSVPISYSPNNVEHLLIGCAGSDIAETYFWSGGIGEVAMYNTALSSNQIAAHYSLGTGITKIPPTITVQPSGGSVLVGSNITLTVQAIGSAPLRYQWQSSGANLAGQTNTSLAILDVVSTNPAPYDVVVTNGFGSVTSAVVNVTAVKVGSSYSSLVLADGAVGYWPLAETNGTVANNLGSSGSVDDGSYYGVILGLPGPIVTSSNTCAEFIAANQTEVNLPYDVLLNGQAFTVEAWAQMTGDGSLTDAGYPDQAVYTCRDFNVYGGITIYGVYGGDWLVYTGTGSGWDVLYTGVPVQSGQWTHLAFTYNGVTKRIYVNGTLAATSTGAYMPNQLDAVPERIGGGDVEVSPGAYFFEGNIGNVAVYNTALPATSIQAHYTIGTTAPYVAPPLISISQSGGNVILTWSGGTLQQSTNLLTGSGWSAVTGVSPLNLGAPTNSNAFFRVMQ
jgi:hypothetical protein